MHAYRIAHNEKTVRIIIIIKAGYIRIFAWHMKCTVQPSGYLNFNTKFLYNSHAKQHNMSSNAVKFSEIISRGAVGDHVFT